MNTAIIVQDPAGYRARVAALEAAHANVFAVSSITHPHPYTLPININSDWLPSDPSLSYDYKCWLKCEAMAVSAILSHNIIADYYWIIESDAVASQARWKALLSDWESIPADCVSQTVRLRSNSQEVKWWHEDTTPEWADAHLLVSCYRLSRNAVLELARCAVEMREIISEITIPSVLRRAKMTMANVNERHSHWNSQTMKTHDWKVIPNANLVNHPVKMDSFDVPACILKEKT